MDQNNFNQPQPDVQPEPQPQFQQAPPPAPPQFQPEPPQGAAPAVQLRTDRSLAKFILLSIITFGIYGLVVMCKISTEINTVASPYDGKKTMHFALVALIFTVLSCGIVPIVWTHRISNRIGDEARRRGLPCDFGAKDYWIWGVLLSCIIVGPFIYYHKFLSAMNMINADYNARG